MSDWKLVHESKGTSGSSKIYQDSEGNVRIDSYNGDVRNPNNHDRFTLNTRNGGMTIITKVSLILQKEKLSN